MIENENDSRLKAFCSIDSPPVFFSIVNASQIWVDDPYDVETINCNARETFKNLLSQVASGRGDGRILMVLGESGSGKTHLMRSFRTSIHGPGLGYFGYLQVSSTGFDTREYNYEQFILSNLIDSLNQPYLSSEETSGLMRLSNAVAETPESMRKKVKLGKRQTGRILTALREWDLKPGQLHKLIGHAIQSILREPGFQNLNMNVLASFLYLQVQDPMLKNLVVSFLRHQSLAPQFKTKVPAIDLNQKLSPLQMIAQIGELMWATRKQVLVICVDQLEGLLNYSDREHRTVQFLDALVNLSSSVPSSLIVISCLKDLYTEIQKPVHASIKTKIENPPSPQTLDYALDRPEVIHELVSNRMFAMFDEMEIKYDKTEPTFPVPEEQLAECTGMPSRHILQLCHSFHENAQKNGYLSEFGGEIQPFREFDFEDRWNDCLSKMSDIPPQQPEALAKLLAKGLVLCGDEIDVPVKTRSHETYIYANIGQTETCMGICNKMAQGGGLKKEIHALEGRAENQPMVIIRNTEFPKSPKAQISCYIGELIAKGNRRAVIEETEWRALMAFPEFYGENVQNQAFEQWRRTYRPLTRYAGIQRVLGTDTSGKIKGAYTAVQPEIINAGIIDTGIIDTKDTSFEKNSHSLDTKAKKSSDNQETKEKGKPEKYGILDLGKSENILKLPVHMSINDLTRHGAFLGGTGSGKSTLAMNLVEQLLLNDIPVVLVDRKGDLCSYADPDVWETKDVREKNQENEKLEQRRRDLKTKLDIKLFTPGHPGGRPLFISIVPDGTHLLPEFERERIAMYSAMALGNMMGFKSGQQDQGCIGILKHAIFLLTELHDSEVVELQEIIDLVGDKDPILVNRMGRLAPKLFDKLVQGLETLRLNRGNLFKEQGVKLSADLLFGLGDFAEPGKTRLSIISTKFLGDNLNIDFYISQLLLELSRWISKKPSDRLQAVIMFDEADIYLPAIRKPSTKEPMEDLLKRARSGGLGIFLATQSPGDLDYKCKENVQSWFLGKIKEPTALSKLKPMLGRSGSEVEKQLPGQRTGRFFLVSDKQIVHFCSDRCVIQLDQLPENRILELSRPFEKSV